jgi:phospholipid/cholesterol/gamma-HCH transport system ATP-binding protein
MPAMNEPRRQRVPSRAPLPQEPLAPGDPGSGAPHISTDHVNTNRVEDGRHAILDDVSFAVPERSITCIMGVSGTGKTTLLRLMAGLLKPDSGEILIEGRNIVPMNEREMNEIRRKMGFVFQYGALFDSLTIAENVGFGLLQQRRPRQEIQEVVTQRLQDVGLPDIEDRLPAELSGGMRKRVAMARALATNPKIVLYDEPTSGLDPVMARVIDDLVVNLRDQAGTTNVVVSHHLPSILRIADHILMLHDGNIVVEGTPQEVQQSDSPVVRQFLEGQASGPITVR